MTKPKVMPESSSSFSVEVEGDWSKQTFSGSFSCKIPRLKEQSQIDKHRVLLNGGLESQLAAQTVDLHYMISYLRFTLTEFPQWWKDSDLGYELLDLNVVKAVYDQVMAFEKSWLIEVWGEEAAQKLHGG